MGLIETHKLNKKSIEKEIRKNIIPIDHRVWKRNEKYVNNFFARLIYLIEVVQSIVVWGWEYLDKIVLDDFILPFTSNATSTWICVSLNSVNFWRLIFMFVNVNIITPDYYLIFSDI